MQPAILLVDDEEDKLDLLERILAVHYRIFKTNCPAKAIKILKEESIQLVVSDVMMPGVSGLELCKFIKSTPEISHIPVILLTENNTLEARIAGLELRADSYIEKPYEEEYLLAKISSLIANRKIMLEYIARMPLAHLKMNHSPEDRTFLETLTNLVHENIEEGDLDVQKLARLMNMSRITLYRRIKNISPYTPNELINMIRLQKAAELLAEGAYRVYEVALMTGYTSQSNFARDFNRHFKISPTEFMESLKKKQTP